MRIRRVLPVLLPAVLAPAALLVTAGSAGAVSSTVVISQIYGGGGNAGSTLKNDYIELYNLSAAPIDLSGYSVAYFSAATGNTGGSTPLTGTIAPGGYFLIQEAQGTAGTTALPTPDATGTLNLSATSGRVDLLQGSTIVDRVGYGTGAALLYEGAAAPGLTNTTADERTNPSVDTDNNAADFTSISPDPHNSATNGPALPESPLGVAIPVAGLGVAGAAALVLRRRRSTRAL